MAWKAQFVTPWTVAPGPDGEDSNHPLFAASGLTHLRWSDVTGQTAAQITPDPNAYTIEVECETEADLDAISAHDDGYVEMWREEIVDPLGGA